MVFSGVAVAVADAVICDPETVITLARRQQQSRTDNWSLPFALN